MVIAPPSTTVWDFSIDSVTFNESVSQAINPNGTPVSTTTATTNAGGPSTVPLPAAAGPAAALLCAMGAVAGIKHRRNQMTALRQI